MGGGGGGEREREREREREPEVNHSNNYNSNKYLKKNILPSVCSQQAAVMLLTSHCNDSIHACNCLVLGPWCYTFTFNILKLAVHIIGREGGG